MAAGKGAERLAGTYLKQRRPGFLKHGFQIVRKTDGMPDMGRPVGGADGILIGYATAGHVAEQG